MLLSLLTSYEDLRCLSDSEDVSFIFLQWVEGHATRKRLRVLFLLICLVLEVCVPLNVTKAGAVVDFTLQG